MLIQTNVQLDFENNAHIINNELLKFKKIWIGCLHRLSKNSGIHVESQVFVT
jgi:hypothetical protein